MTTRLRISQPRYCHQATYGYRPEIPSDGLTLDTPDGPVDLVAVERALKGQPTPVTKADVRYATSLLPNGRLEHTVLAGAGLGISSAAVQRAHDRRKAETRTQT